MQRHEVCSRYLFAPSIVLGLTVALSVAATATEPPITAVTFTPDGQAVVAVSQAGMQVCSWPDLKRQRTSKASVPNLHCAAFSPDGQHLAIGGGYPAEDGSVELRSWPAGTPTAKLGDHDDSVRAVVWLDSSRLLSASADRQIRLWDMKTPRELVRVLQSHSRSVDALCLLEDGKTLVSAGVDQSVRVWDLETGALVRSMNQHTQGVHDLALRPGEGGLPMVASAAGDRTIRFWQPTIGRMVRYVRLDAMPMDIAWRSDGSQIVAACADGRIRVVDPEEVKVTETLDAIDGWAYAVAVHPHQNRVVVGGSDGQLKKVTIRSAGNADISVR
ncbi:WD40 repeat domain-containing protein [Roseimaritima sediminicola]|uniref:WD40 repeat domain-containing protein n=1 Tax=Roseimaritima sediminicola TaxID=2662066 RepID=UPI00129849D0|nr:WD40 repeat domain-containing protein [Roseimaritima sediminicola]